MVNLLKLLVIALFLAGMGIALWAFNELNVQPTLQTGSLLLALTLAATLIIGPALAVLAGRWARTVLRDDLQQIVDSPVPRIHRQLAALALDNPLAYYALIALFIGGTFGYCTWGGGTLYERRHAQPAGDITCTVLATRAEGANARLRLKLSCPVAAASAKTEVLLSYVPGRVPEQVTLPQRKGALGSVFVDGSQLRL